VLVAALPRFDGDGNGRLSESEFVRMLQTLANERMAQRRADAELLRQIQQRLNSVTGMPSAGIKLSAKDGAVVVAGMVRDAQLARQAYNAIRWTPGLRSLDNRLMPAEILLFD
jgi:osmotically-inducible protein OsmY